MGIQHNQEHSPPQSGQESQPAAQRMIARAKKLPAIQAREVEAQLRRSAERFHALAVATGQIIWTTNPEGFAEEALPNWRAFTGQSFEEAQGWGWLDVVHPADREQVAYRWSQAVANCSVFESEQRVRRTDGVYRVCLLRRAPVFEPDGSVREWVGFCIDMTERHQQDEERTRQLAHEQETRRELEATLTALRKSETRTRRLVEANVIGVIVGDDRRILDANDAFLKLVGYSREELLAGALRWPEMTPPEYRRLDRNALKQMLATGGSTPYEKEFLRKDGSRVPVLLGAALLEESPPTSVCFVLDLTERRQAEAERGQLARRNQQALQGLLEMAEALVHLPDAEAQADEAHAPALAYGVVRRLAELTRNLLGCQRINIVFLEPGTEAFQPVVAVGVTPEDEQAWRAAIQGVHLQDYFTPQVVERLRAGATLVIDEADRLVAARQSARNIRPFLLAPLYVGDDMIGGLTLDYGAEAHTYLPDEMALAAAVARMVSVVVHREWLARRSGQRSAELAAASQAVRAIAQQWDIDQILAAVLNQAKSVLGNTAAFLLVLDPASHELKLLSASGLSSEKQAQLGKLRVDLESFMGRAAMGKEILVVENLQADLLDQAPIAAFLSAEGMGSLVAVPLEANRHPVGVLGFVAPSVRAYDHDARHFLRLLGDIFAVAINAVSLQERLRLSNAQLVTASLQAQQRAESLEEEKEGRETFISLVAHELRSPLTVLSGYIQLLEQGKSNDETRRETALRKMREQSNRLKRLIDDLLDVSRIASGHFAIEPDTTDLAALARKAVEEAQSTTQRHTLRLILPEASLLGIWDRQRLAQVFSNLLSNAIKYSPQGGNIEVVIHCEDDGVQVVVQDQGAGLTSEEIDRLFQPYSRLDRTRHAAGNGLGLYLTRGIIEAHGGRIWATSPGPDQGSAFTFTLLYQAPPSYETPEA